MSVPLDELTAAQLTTSDAIWAVDSQTGFELLVHGPAGVAAGRPYPNDANTLRLLQVEVDSARPGELQDLLRRVEALKGRLPADVRRFLE